MMQSYDSGSQPSVRWTASEASDAQSIDAAHAIERRILTRYVDSPGLVIRRALNSLVGRLVRRANQRLPLLDSIRRRWSLRGRQVQRGLRPLVLRRPSSASGVVSSDEDMPSPDTSSALTADHDELSNLPRITGKRRAPSVSDTVGRIGSNLQIPLARAAALLPVGTDRPDNQGRWDPQQASSRHYLAGPQVAWRGAQLSASTALETASADLERRAPLKPAVNAVGQTEPSVNASTLGLEFAQSRASGESVQSIRSVPVQSALMVARLRTPAATTKPAPKMTLLHRSGITSRGPGAARPIPMARTRLFPTAIRRIRSGILQPSNDATMDDAPLPASGAWSIANDAVASQVTDLGGRENLASALTMPATRQSAHARVAAIVAPSSMTGQLGEAASSNPPTAQPVARQAVNASTLGSEFAQSRASGDFVQSIRSVPVQSALMVARLRTPAMTTKPAPKMTLLHRPGITSRGPGAARPIPMARTRLFPTAIRRIRSGILQPSNDATMDAPLPASGAWPIANDAVASQITDLGGRENLAFALTMPATRQSAHARVAAIVAPSSMTGQLGEAASSNPPTAQPVARQAVNASTLGSEFAQSRASGDFVQSIRSVPVQSALMVARLRTPAATTKPAPKMTLLHRTGITSRGLGAARPIPMARTRLFPPAIRRVRTGILQPSNDATMDAPLPASDAWSIANDAVAAQVTDLGGRENLASALTMPATRQSAHARVADIVAPSSMTGQLGEAASSNPPTAQPVARQVMVSTIAARADTHSGEKPLLHRWAKLSHIPGIMDRQRVKTESYRTANPRTTRVGHTIEHAAQREASPVRGWHASINGRQPLAHHLDFTRVEMPLVSGGAVAQREAAPDLVQTQMAGKRGGSQQSEPGNAYSERAPVSPALTTAMAAGNGNRQAEQTNRQSGLEEFDIDQIADRVYAIIEQRLVIERESLGL